jgi:energy-coupling factor transporter ATP-binding protein EcfA2
VAAVRLVRVDIEQFRSVADQQVPVRGLVVLFGPNSAGKTTVLEAVASVLARESRLREDPGDDDPLVLGWAQFVLPNARVPGSGDALLYVGLLQGEYHGPGVFGVEEDPWGWIEGGLGERLGGTDPAQVREVLAGSLARAGEAGRREDREVLARAVFDPGSVYFWADHGSVSMNASLGSLPPVAVAAARRLAGTGGGDPLCKVAAELVDAGWAHLAWLGSVHGGAELASSFPPVIVLDGDVDSLSAELESSVEAVHDRMWHFEPEMIERFPDGSVIITGPAGFEIGGHADSGRYSVDSWLETQTTEGRAAPASVHDPYDQHDWYRVSHGVLAAAKAIEAEANLVAPGFVKNQGTIGVEVLPVAVWAAGRRVRATFTEHRQDRRDLRVVGAGTSRWAAAAIRLASRRLTHGRQVVLDGTGTPVTDSGERRRLVIEAYAAPLTQAAVQLVPADSPAVYIADEPESHLHPAALHSVREWLSDLAETAAAVLVATHSTAVLDSPSGRIRRVLVLPSAEGTVLREMTGALDDELVRVSGVFGLSKGELLLLARLALFVEGPHDQIILEEWFGGRLRAAGIHVFPVRGVDNLPGLVTAGIVPALGIRLAAVTDGTDMARVLAGTPQTRGETAVARMLSEAAQAGVRVHAAGLGKPDILFYLDEETCRQAAPGFPGWEAAIRNWQDSGSRAPWKRWVKNTYRLPLTHDGIRELARQCQDRQQIPAELSQVISGLTAYAAGTEAGST